MFHRQIEELRRYFRADYAREIAARNMDKSLQERWQLIAASEEHQRRQIFATARAQCIAIISLVPLAVIAIGLVSTHRLHDEVELDIGSHRVPDAIVYLAMALYVVPAAILGWHVGTRRARKQLDRRGLAPASAGR